MLGLATPFMPEYTSHKKKSDMLASVCSKRSTANVITGKNTAKMVDTMMRDLAAPTAAMPIAQLQTMADSMH